MQKLNIAVQADYLSDLAVHSDSSLFIAARACRAGINVYFYHPSSLYIMQNKVRCRATFVNVSYENFISSFEVIEERIIDLTMMDAIFIRQNPPFNLQYITSTYILELLPANIQIFNNPAAIRNNPEKLIPLRFPDLIPKTLIVSNSWDPTYESSIQDFGDELIIKPLYGFGSNNIIKITRDELQDAACTALEQHQDIIIQEFLPNVIKGDTRVTMLQGKVVGVMRRMPSHGDIRSSLRAGATPHPATLNTIEQEICMKLGIFLQENRILLAGIDIIDNKLMEVNITSPTGLVALHKLYDLDIAQQIVEILY